MANWSFHNFLERKGINQLGIRRHNDSRQGTKGTEHLGVALNLEFIFLQICAIAKNQNDFFKVDQTWRLKLLTNNTTCDMCNPETGLPFRYCKSNFSWRKCLLSIELMTLCLPTHVRVTFHDLYVLISIERLI